MMHCMQKIMCEDGVLVNITKYILWYIFWYSYCLLGEVIYFIININNTLAYVALILVEDIIFEKYHCVYKI